jgi:DNA-binding NtrC family response regulator
LAICAQPVRSPYQLISRSGALDGTDEPHLPPVLPMSTTRAVGAWPIHVLICVENAGVRELISILLADAGCTTTGMDVESWLIGDPIPEPSPKVLILDAWPLRHDDAANQAQARLAAQPAALVLLLDSPQPAQLADQLGAVTILPLLFTLQNLVTAVQRSSEASTHIRRAP